MPDLPLRLFRPGSPIPPFLAVLLPLALFCLSGCSSPPPSPDEAARAIIASSLFQGARWLSVKGRESSACRDALAAHPDWARWINLGLAQSMDIVSPAGPTCALSLTESARREAQNWMHRVDPSVTQSLDQVVLPVAVRTFARIIAIRQAASGVAEADFEWQWRPNQAGQKLLIDTAVHGGWARLSLEDQGWRASSVRADN